MDILALILQLSVLAITLMIIVHFSLGIRKNKIMHNVCHTDKISVDDIHGHTEPHV